MTIARLSATILAAFFLIVSTTSFAQAPAPGGAPRGKQVPAAGGPGFRGAAGTGSSPLSKSIQLESLKQTLALSDEEWKTLSPKVEKVLDAKINLNTGAGMNWTSSNGAKPTFQASTSRPDTPPGHAMQSVRDAAADEAASDEELAKRMAAVRAARQKAREAYDTAQKELSEAITRRQEAVLMTLGVLE